MIGFQDHHKRLLFAFDFMDSVLPSFEFDVVDPFENKFSFDNSIDC